MSVVCRWYGGMSVVILLRFSSIRLPIRWYSGVIEPPIRVLLVEVFYYRTRWYSVSLFWWYSGGAPPSVRAFALAVDDLEGAEVEVLAEVL